MAIARVLLGRIQDTKGDNTIALPLFFVFALGLITLCFPSGFTLIATAILIAVGYGGIFPAFQTIAVRGVPFEHIAVATSTFFVFADAGLGIGPMIGGLFIEDIGYAGLYLGCAGLVLLSGILYWVLHGSKEIV